MKKHNKWYMTDDEIRRSWRCCKDQIEQIGILAELNCKTKDEVVDKLTELGIKVPMRISGRGIKTKMTESLRKKIWRMKQEGMSYTQIRAQLFETRLSVECIRSEYRQMIKEREEVRPILVKALREYMNGGACSETEAELIRRQIARGI